MEQGWSLNAMEQTMDHPPTSTKIPVDMQNRSLVISGCIRMVQEEPQYVRALRATLLGPLRGLQHGWHLIGTGFETGFHISDGYINPLEYNPNYGNMCRTTLVQCRDGHWEVLEFCESLTEQAFHGVKFEEEGMRGVVTILTPNSVAPENMGFEFEDEFTMPDPSDREAAWEVPRAPEDDQMEEDAGQVEQPHAEAEHAEPEAAAAETPPDEIVLEPFNPDRIVVNGIPLEASSGTAELKAACAFFGLSTSGSKMKLCRRLVGHMKKQELDAAQEAVHVAENLHRRDPHFHVAPNRPSEEEVERHNLTHVPFQGSST